MTDHQFAVCWSEAASYADQDEFVSDLAISSIWDDAAGDAAPQERVDQLRRIWTVQHMTMREIRDASGMTQAKYAAHFCAPKRTVENWDSGTNTPPDYAKIMIAKDLGLL